MGTLDRAVPTGKLPSEVVYLDYFLLEIGLSTSNGVLRVLDLTKQIDDPCLGDVLVATRSDQIGLKRHYAGSGRSNLVRKLLVPSLQLSFFAVRGLFGVKNVKLVLFLGRIQFSI